ncbi:Kef-type K+ transport system membrane component KefB [Saccharothrix tamanrassetensis]|uniref:Kef-type K+ transport system membrane component KefB n=1 Tax=Saccharothrix tamanrassetensis TaxID=1051531 RepID=A0A841CCH0_9PSEU|nr:cation:proton antiporter [Saccharothrix tamanrassetensis]MBB5953868.1 Kef-type K+ transport system membrane component KefB [Saccharothrix tamanrassetensis]
MSVGGVALFLGHLLAWTAIVLLLAWLGRITARRLRQPEVVGEITGGLLVGPALHALAGADAFAVLLPGDVLHGLKLLGEAGLALFLLGLTHELRTGPVRFGRRVVAGIVAGSLVPSLCAGGLLAGWVLLVDDPALRGTAPLPAFVLFIAVGLSITAVPVLARILADQGLTGSREGRLALTGAIILDAAGWVLLSVVLGLNTRSLAGLLQMLATMVAAVLVVLVLGRILRTRAAGAWAGGYPRSATVAVAVASIAAALTAEAVGVTMIFGAVLFGLAIPANSPVWDAVVATVTRGGRSLVPVFFVVTGVTVLTAGFGAAPWALLGLATGLGILGKVGGGYLGARLGGESRWTSVRVGVLMNTRGLTELIVLQVGYSAGIVTPPMFLALVVMALVTTALTGPLLSLLDRARSRAATTPPRRL